MLLYFTQRKVRNSSEIMADIFSYILVLVKQAIYPSYTYLKSGFNRPRHKSSELRLRPNTSEKHDFQTHFVKQHQQLHTAQEEISRVSTRNEPQVITVGFRYEAIQYKWYCTRYKKDSMWMANPELALMCKARDICCDELEETEPHHNGTAL